MSGEQGGVVEVKKNEEGLTEEEIAFRAEMASEVVEADAVAPASNQSAASTEAKVDPVEPVVERVEVIPGYTAEELKAKFEHVDRLQKAVDTTAGTMGSRLAEQQQLITQLQAQRQAVGSLTPDKLKKLSAEYPELADILASDLNDVLGQPGQAATFDPKQIESIATSIAEQKILEADRKRELVYLAKKHSDWKELASFVPDPQTNAPIWKNPKFGEWVRKQPAEVGQKISGQWDPDYVMEQLDKFKGASKPVKQELDVAVLPRGGARKVVDTSGLSEEEKAFREEMARH